MHVSIDFTKFIYFALRFVCDEVLALQAEIEDSNTALKEAEQNISALLSLVSRYEQQAIPSVTTLEVSPSSEYSRHTVHTPMSTQQTPTDLMVCYLDYKFKNGTTDCYDTRWYVSGCAEHGRHTVGRR